MNKFFTERIQLSTISFPRFMSAPVDGVIDSPMRQMIRMFSTDELLFTEMRHVSCVANEKSGRSLIYEPIEQPLAFQVSANSTKFMGIAVQKILAHNFVMLNLNAGCPARNIIKSGTGSALMADPDLLTTLITTLQQELKHKIPFTLKIRAGFKEKNALTIAKLAQDCGVEMLIIHPRTQTQAFAGDLDYDLVAQIKQSISIPLVFSGNICTFDDAKMTYERTGVDGFMIGRALWGAPWKLKEMAAQMHNETFALTTQEIVDIAQRHLDLSVDFYGIYGVDAFKSHLVRYVKGLPNASALRRDLLVIKDHGEMKAALKRIKD